MWLFIKIGLVLNFTAFIWSCIQQLRNLDDVKEGEILSTIFNTIYVAFWRSLLWPLILIREGYQLTVKLRNYWRKHKFL